MLQDKHELEVSVKQEDMEVSVKQVDTNDAFEETRSIDNDMIKKKLIGNQCIGCLWRIGIGFLKFSLI